MDKFEMGNLFIYGIILDKLFLFKDEFFVFNLNLVIVCIILF